MILPAPIATSPPISHEIHVTAASRRVRNLCAPYINLKLGSNTRYDLFVDSVAKEEVQGVCMANNQKSADLLMIDGSHETIYFPDNYDIVSYLVENDVPVEIKEAQNKPSVVDITTVLIQVAIVRLVAKFFDRKNSSGSGSPAEDVLFEAMKATSYFGHDLHNFMQFTYNFGKALSKEDIDNMVRVISCKVYVNNRILRRMLKKKQKKLASSASAS